MNQAKLNYSSTAALLFFFYLTVIFAEGLFISKYVKKQGKFLGTGTKTWEILHPSAGTIFTLLTLMHLAYRKDRIMFMLRYLAAK